MPAWASSQATTVIEPSQLSVGKSQAVPRTFTLSVKNESSTSLTYDLSAVDSVAAAPNTRSGASYNITGTFLAPASVSFSVPSITVPARGTASFNVTIDANPSLPDRSRYGGYVVLTPQGGGATYSVPFAGFKGDYQSTQVLTPTANGFPWLTTLSGGTFTNQPAGATYTMGGDDIPYCPIHLDHLPRRVRLEAFDAVTGRSWHRVSNDQFVTRNSTPGGFFAFTWDGSTFTCKGRNASQLYSVPNGQ